MFFYGLRRWFDWFAGGRSSLAVGMLRWRVAGGWLSFLISLTLLPVLALALAHVLVFALVLVLALALALAALDLRPLAFPMSHTRRQGQGQKLW
jgi:hypothetical protein